jgi:squalene-hopene/tetraprenyl-beta-curcumene cyclase
LAKACEWLFSIQNADGGWGESTKSYHDDKWIGRGKSTATQTAWALMTLIECGHAKTDSVKSGIRYLIDQFNEEGHWEDTCVVGTGHPGLIYLEYPSYPHTFPLIALGKYIKTLSK